MLFLTVISESEGGFNPLGPESISVAFWTWVIFLGSLPLIWKIVMGPITRALTDRDEEAAKAVHAAEKASEEAEKARAEVEVKLGEARTEAVALLEEARGRAEVRGRDIVERAKKEASMLVEHAREQIRGEQDKAMTAIRNEVVELSLKAAGQVLNRAVDSEDDRRLATELVMATEEQG